MRKRTRYVAIILVMSLLCTIISMSQPICAESIEDGTKTWITSGIYQYQVTDAEKKYAAIRKINTTSPVVEIPEMIDGYTVKYLGSPTYISDWQEYDREARVMGENKNTLEEVRIPKSVWWIGEGAFASCINLKKVFFPKGDILIIKENAFYGCDQLADIALSAAEAYSGAFGGTRPINRLALNNVSLLDSDNGEAFPGRKIKKLVLENYSCFKMINITKTWIDKVYVKSSTDEVDFLTSSDPGIKKLYVNGGLTKLKRGVSDQVERLYTIPHAKAISWAKKLHVPYDVKSTGKMGKVTKKKKGKNYQYSWKAVKTTIKSYQYKQKKKAWVWKVTKKKAATQYKVYGKKKKGDSYQLIKTTKKRQFTTPYKYVKVKPVKAWLE